MCGAGFGVQGVGADCGLQILGCRFWDEGVWHKVWCAGFGGAGHGVQV